ncbi:MAG: hypothetical protein PUC65_10070 [Clostridiales bacterium]|nr:hypothetical protein [Clostridiales bacterium]
MKFLNKMERKFGRYAIHNLMAYVIGLYIAGIVIFMVNPAFYYQWLMLDFGKIAQGQIWRLVTFLIQPVEHINLFILISLYLYYMIGNSLENTWGAFRFNLYYFSGVLFNILAAFIIYLATGFSFPLSLEYINDAMFFAFGVLYPNISFLLFFVIPVKVKYLVLMYAVLFGYNVIEVMKTGAWWYGLAMLVAIANFLIFFALTRNYNRISPTQVKRRANYKKQVRNANNPDNVVQFRGRQTVTRHKCAVCGRTELDDEDLEFRFCSKCDGNYEYCMDHLYTHEHVHKDSASPEQHSV